MRHAKAIEGNVPHLLFLPKRLEPSRLTAIFIIYLSISVYEARPINDTKLFSENVLTGFPLNSPFAIKSQPISTGSEAVEYPNSLD